MKCEYTPKHTPEITLSYTTDDGIEITHIDINGEPIGEFLEGVLLEHHGDRWAAEIEAKIRAEYETNRAEYLAYDIFEERRWV